MHKNQTNYKRSKAEENVLAEVGHMKIGQQMGTHKMELRVHHLHHGRGSQEDGYI